MEGRTFHFRGRKPHGIQHLGIRRTARCGLILPDAANSQQDR